MNRDPPCQILKSMRWVLLEADADVDEETGLTGKERQKHIQRKKWRDALDFRIGGGGGISKEEAKQADRNVIRNLLFNAVLIGLWYIFSLSISIVGLLSHVHLTAGLTLLVQQMDVLRRLPRLPLPTIHNLAPHDRPILPGLHGPSNLSILTTTITSAYTVWRRSQTSSHTNILLHTPRPHRHSHLPRHRPR